MESSADVAKKIAETLNWKLVGIQETFNIEEDKEGFFTVTLNPKKFIDTADFKAICALTRDLGGQGEYIKATRSWKVPSRFVSNKTEKSSKEPSNPKTEPPSIPVKLGFYEHFPTAWILSPAFTLRMNLEEGVQELIDQIGTTNAGAEHCVIFEPLVCRPAKKAGFVEVAAGERRLLAAKKIGLGIAPIVVKDMSDEEFDRIRMMENVARKDLTDYETGRALKYLMDTYPNKYPAQINVADVFGKSQDWVSRHIAVLQLDGIMPRGVMENGDFTERQAREILSAPEDKREAIIGEINKTGEVPSAREIHELAHPEEKPKSVPCAECGTSTSNPISTKDGKFYCSEECKQDAEAKAASDTGEASEEVTEEPEKTVEKPHKPEPLLTGYPWTCPECGAKYIINHVDFPDSDRKEHRLEACGQ